MLFDPSLAAPLGGLSLIVVGSFLWARQQKGVLWYAFCGGFALLLLAFLLELIFAPGEGSTTRGLTIFHIVMEVVKMLGLWLSAIAMLVLGIAANASRKE